MRKNLLFVGILISLFLLANTVNAQLFYNKGALVTIQNGASVHIQGGLRNTDVGANNATIDVSGNLWAKTTSGDVILDPASDMAVNNTGIVYVAGDWTNAGNFVANTGSKVVFNGGAGALQTYDHTASTGWQFYNVDVETDEISLSTNMDIKAGGVLKFNGVGMNNMITTGSNFVRMLTSGATLSSFSGHNSVGAAVLSQLNYVNGNVRWQMSDFKTTYEFPVGQAVGADANLEGAQYFQITSSNMSTGDGFAWLEGNYDANLVSGPASGCQYTSITYYTGTFNWEPYDAAMVNITMMPAGKDYSVNMRPRSTYAADDANIGATIDHGTGWSLYVDGGGTCVNMPDRTTITADYQNLFSSGGGFSGTPVVPLPVENLLFDARPLTNSILLDWQTGREINTSYFDLQRSLDGQVFTTIKGGVNTNGNENQGANYSFEDINVDFNTRYLYRLKIVDNDGGFYFSEVREAILHESDINKVSVYPNPSSGSLFVRFTQPEDGKTKIEIIDAIGKIVVNKTFSLNAGSQEIVLTPMFENLSKGLYTIAIHRNDKTFYEKVTKN